MAWHWNPDKLFDDIVSIKWIYTKIFGTELLERLVYDPEYERSKRILSEVYGYENVDKVFWKQILRNEFKNISRIIFKVYEKAWVWNGN